jgi:hypothetical protein
VKKYKSERHKDEKLKTMTEFLPQGKPSIGKCSKIELVVEYNTPPQASSGDNFVRTESIVVMN